MGVYKFSGDRYNRDKALFEKWKYDQGREILLPDEAGLTQESISCNDPIEGSCTIILQQALDAPVAES